MRTELFFDPKGPKSRRDEVLASFEVAGVTVDRRGHAALKSADVFGLRIDAAFLLEVAIAGLLWDAEKAALRRGIEVLRTVWQVSGTVGIEPLDRPESQPPTMYYVPGGEDGDRALDAIDEDYETAGSGIRLWDHEEGRWTAYEG